MSGATKMSNRIPLEDDHYCFACGKENLSGLRIHWEIIGKTTQAEFVPKKEHQGWKNIVHGGILATLLDEAMTRLAWVVCGGALTAEIQVRYLKPAHIGEKLLIFGEIIKENRKLVEMKAKVYKQDKDSKAILIAHSNGKALKI